MLPPLTPIHKQNSRKKAPQHALLIPFANKIQILVQNLQSINNKTYILESLLEEKLYEIVCLSETWINEDRAQSIQINNYNFASSYNRRHYRGGGVAILTREGVAYKELVDFKKLSVEYVTECCAIEVIEHNLIIISIHRLDRDIDTFFSVIDEIVKKIKRFTSNKQIILTGDFNIDRKKKRKIYIKLCNILLTCNLHQIINQPTRITKYTSTCIDFLFTNSKNCEAVVNNNGISDHSSLICTYLSNNKQTINQSYFITKRVFTVKNMLNFKSELSNVVWKNILTYNNDINSNFNTFHYTIQALLDKIIPKKRIKVGKKRKTSWLTKGLKKSCRHKRLLKIIVNQTGSKVFKKFHDTYQKVLKKCIKLSKKNNYTKILKTSRNKQKTMWSIINDITRYNNKSKREKIILKDSNVVTECPREIANAFNDYFASIGEPPVSSRRASEAHGCLTAGGSGHPRTIAPIENSMYLQPVTEQEVRKIIQQLPNKYSYGADEIPNTLIKTCIDELSSPLTSIINQSFEEECFPDKLKIAKIKPVFKKGGNKSNISHYRPIALLPVYSKIIEKAMTTRIYNFLEKFKVLNNNQYGFRQNRSTIDAVIKYIQETLTYIQDKHYAVSILLDMTKAYDKVVHNILLSKLYEMGIRGRAFGWIRSYLYNRQQFVEIEFFNDDTLEVEISKSEIRYTNWSIPQGSVIGCILFIAYINQLPNVIHSPCILFADDVSILFKCKDDSESRDNIIKSFQSVQNWLHEHNLEVNLKKTKIMQFRPRQKVKLDLKPVIDKLKIEEAQEYKLLGLTIDTHLTWVTHVQTVKSKLSQFTYALAILKSNTHQEAALSAYYAYAYAWMRYGVLLWGNSTDAQDIFILQKKCIRILFNIRPRNSCRPYFLSEKILPLPCIFILEAALFIRKNINQFTYCKSARRKHLLNLPISDMKIFKQGPHYAALKIYNKVPIQIKSETKDKPFYFKLKQFLLSKCYYTLDEFYCEK